VSDDVLADQTALRSQYRDPHPAVLAKVQSDVDAGSASFLAASPFMVVATTAASGTDASPRGGPPGFVRVLDGQHVAWGDLAGNNRLDSHQNIVEHPEVGLLFFVPGVQDMLRINGAASVSIEPSVLDATTVDGVRPKVAVVVEVRECYIHCAKAIRRSGIWDASTWPSVDARPRAAAIVGKHLALDVDPSLIEADLEAGYAVTIWEPGGCDAD
jgi:PPOX class probable FMN-dependent enzyme